MSNASPAADFAKTLSFLQDIQEKHSLLDLAAAVQNAVSDRGIVNVVAAFVPPPQSTPEEQICNVLFTNWPEAWIETYVEKGYASVDPAVKRVKNLEPIFLWSDFVQKGEITESEKYVMDHAKDHQLKDGWSTSLMSLDGRVACFSFAGQNIDRSPDIRGMLNFVASLAFARAIEIKSGKVPAPAELTAREQEVLKWLGEGKTDWEIGMILGLSEKTIEKHMRNIRIKLSAVNRHHALAEAFRQKIIT